MSNYEVFNAKIKSVEQYESLSNNIYNTPEYTEGEISYYVKGLSFGFIGRVKVFFVQALASVGLISGVERDVRIAAEVNRIGRTLIQQIGRASGYYAQERTGKLSLLEDDDVSEQSKEIPPLDDRVRLLTPGQEMMQSAVDRGVQGKNQPPAFNLPESIFPEFPGG